MIYVHNLKSQNIPSSIAQYSLQRAHLSFSMTPFELTLVAHHHFPLPSLLHPVYFFPLYVKGNTQSSTGPFLLPNLSPLPCALQVMCFPTMKIYSKQTFCMITGRKDINSLKKYSRPSITVFIKRLGFSNDHLDLPNKICYSEPISSNCLVCQLLLHIVVLFLFLEMVHNQCAACHFVWREICNLGHYLYLCNSVYFVHLPYIYDICLHGKNILIKIHV